MKKQPADEKLPFPTKSFSQTATCGICGEEVKLSGAKIHLKKCRQQNPLPMGKKETEIFMLRIRGSYLKD